MKMVTGIFGAIALGALILGLIWWMRSLDRSRGKPQSPMQKTTGISAAFKRSDSDMSERP
jgi:hypothetical protein